MSTVTLEALRAGKGDCLVLRRVGDDGTTLVVIDGGPSGVFKRALKRRLDSILDALPADDEGGKLSLPIDAVIVSHIDDDHIVGLIDLTLHLIEQPHSGNRDYLIKHLWHNSFELLTAQKSPLAALPQSVASAGIGDIANTLGVSDDDAFVIASVGQGSRLANNARGLSIPMNKGWNGSIVADVAKPPSTLGPGVLATVVCPSPEQVAALQKAWAKEAGGPVKAAAFDDDKVWNLSSIVVLVDADGKKLLLTGDARGDYVLAGLRAMNLLSDDNPTFPVDVLKVPHHGSAHSNDVPLFEACPADHYVISGNGQHGNPSLEVVQMLIETRARRGGEFTLHFTYPFADFKSHNGEPYRVADLEAVIASAKENNVSVHIATPASDDLGVLVTL